MPQRFLGVSVENNIHDSPALQLHQLLGYFTTLQLGLSKVPRKSDCKGIVTSLILPETTVHHQGLYAVVSKVIGSYICVMALLMLLLSSQLYTIPI